MISAEEALQQLKEGNRRFGRGRLRRVKDLTNRERRSEVMEGHEPFAIVLGCSDARLHRLCPRVRNDDNKSLPSTTKNKRRSRG